MALPSLVGTSVGNSLGGSGSTWTTPAKSTTTGNFLFVALTHYTASVNVTGVADTAGNVYQKAGTTQGGDSSQDNEIWYTPNPITGNASNVVTVTANGTASFRNVAQAEFSWSGATSIAYDAEAAHAFVTFVNDVSDSTLTSNNVTTTVAEALLLGNFVAFDNPMALNSDTNGTKLWEAGAGTAEDDMVMAYRTVSSQGAYPVVVRGPQGTSDRYSIVVKAFRAVVSGDQTVNATGLSATATVNGVTLSGTINRVDYIGISSSTPEANNADITLTEPASVQPGDLLIACIAHRGTIGYQKPSDWTSKLLDQSSGNTSTITSSSIASGELFYTIRGSSAPTLTFTKEAGTGDVARGVIVALRGQDTTTPIRASLQTTLGSNSATVVTGSGITPTAGDCVLGFWCGADNVTWSSEQINGTPTALSEVRDAGSNTGADNSIGVAYLTITQESISNQTVQATASGSSRHAVLVVDVAPLPTSTPVTVTLGAGFLATASVATPTVAVHQPVSVTGLGATATHGSVAVAALANATPTGLASTVTIGSPSVTAAAQISISVTGAVSDPTFVNATGNLISGSGTTGASPALSTTTGNFLVGQVSHLTAGVNVSSATDSAGNTWQRAGTTQGGGANHDHEIWYTPNPIVGNANNVVTFSFSGGAAFFRVAAQSQFSWPGAQSIAFDAEAAHAFTGSGSTTVATGTVSTASADELIVSGLIAWDSPQELGDGTGTIAWESGAGAADDAAIAYRNTDAAGAYTLTLTKPNTADNYSVVAKAFRATVASTGTQSSIGSPTVTISSATNVNVTGQSATATLGTPTQTAAANATPAGQAATATRGTPGISVGDLTWASYPGATSYRLYWGTTSALYTQNANVGNVLTYPISSLGLAANTTYYVQVRAFDGTEHDHEAEKVVLNSVISTNPFLVLLVTGLGATATRGSPIVTAGASPLSPSVAAASTVGAVTVSAVGNATVNVMGLSATAARGDVTAAMVVNVPVVGLSATATRGTPIPTAPVTFSIIGFGLAITRGTPGAFGGSLVWGASPTAISYRIYWGTTAGVYTQSVDVGNVLSYSMALLGLQRETTYYSVIRAWDGALESANSGEIILFNGGMLAEPYTLASVPGRAATAARGTPVVSIIVSPALVGRSATAIIGTVSVTTTSNIFVDLVGRAAASTVGAPVAQAAAVVPLTGQTVVSDRGTVTVIADTVQNASVPVIGLLTTSTRGSVTAVGAASPSAAGLLATTAVGLPVASVSTPVSVAGFAATATRGTVSVTGTTSVALIGRQATSFVGATVVSAPSVTSVTGVGAVSELNALDIDVNASVEYETLGRSASLQLGQIAVTIQGSVSFGVLGMDAALSHGIFQVIGHASVSANGGLGMTSALNAPVIAIAPQVAPAGLLNTASFGFVTVQTAAGSVSADLTGLSTSVSTPGALAKTDVIVILNAGFYIVSEINFVDFGFGAVANVTGVGATTEVGLVSHNNDTTINVAGISLVASIGPVQVKQNITVFLSGLDLGISLGNVKVRTRNPHSNWVNVMVRSSRSIFRPGRMW